MELGDRIAAWLRIRGMTQKALAKAVGVTPGAVTAWIKGDPSDRSHPTQKNLERIVATFGLTMAEFYGAMPKTKRPGLAA